MRARSEHQSMSPARARPNPAPTATPSTFTITGTGQSCTATTDSASWRMAVNLLPSHPGSAPPGFFTMSAPEQKSPLAPVRITQRASDAEISRNASRMVSHMFIEHAFLVPGRSSVTVTRPASSRTTFTCSSVIIGGPPGSRRGSESATCRSVVQHLRRSGSVEVPSARTGGYDRPMSQAVPDPVDGEVDWHRRVVGRSLKTAQARSIDRGAALIHAAAALLERSDGDGFTVQDVADEAKQSLRTLYQYFESKDDLLLAVFEEAMRTYARVVEAAIVDLADPLERLGGALLAAGRL